jgi:hypothetical protein
MRIGTRIGRAPYPGLALARVGLVELSRMARRADSRVGENRLGDQNRGARAARKRGWIVLESGV